MLYKLKPLKECKPFKYKDNRYAIGTDPRMEYLTRTSFEVIQRDGYLEVEVGMEIMSRGYWKVCPDWLIPQIDCLDFFESL